MVEDTVPPALHSTTQLATNNLTHSSRKTAQINNMLVKESMAECYVKTDELTPVTKDLVPENPLLRTEGIITKTSSLSTALQTSTTKWQ